MNDVYTMLRYSADDVIRIASNELARMQKDAENITKEEYIEIMKTILECLNIEED